MKLLVKLDVNQPGYNTDELVSVSPGRLRWLENSWAVIDLSGLLIEINHQLAASLLYCYQYYVGGGAEDD